MAVAIASRTRTQIRQSISKNIGTEQAFFGTASTNGSTSTLVDAYGLVGYGDDNLIGCQIYLTVTATGAVEKAWITDSVSSTGTVTFAPVRTSTTTGQAYEIYRRPIYAENIHDMIDQAVVDASDEAFVERADTSLATQRDLYEYPIPSGLVGIYRVEYVSSDDSELLSDCNTAWTAGTNSTVTLDTEQYRVGNACNKITVSAAASTNEVVANVDLASTQDLSGYDTIEMWVKSSVALTAADYAFTFVNMVALGSLSFPAVTANTWTKLQLTISSPQTYTAVAGIAITQVVDKGSMTLYIDDVRISKSGSRIFETIPQNLWSIVRGSTAYLKLSPAARALAGTNKILKLGGYEKPDLMTTDASVSEVDPDYIVNLVTARIMMNDTNRKDQAAYYFNLAEKRNIQTALNPYTRMVV